MRLIDADRLIALFDAELRLLRDELADPETDPEVKAYEKVRAQVESLARKGVDVAA